MARKNLLYAQSGGVTPVINASAAALIETARAHRSDLGRVYAARDGILGVLQERLVDTRQLKKRDLEHLTQTPGGVFGSCRYKLKSLEESAREYQRLIDVFKAHDIGYFFYNGGNDSADTALKISEMARQQSVDLQCIAVPKTIDNDLAVTDNCPGFGSVAKYVAVSVMEASLDVMSMASSSTKVFILEVMGRHAGWIAAAGGLAAREKGGSAANYPVSRSALRSEALPGSRQAVGRDEWVLLDCRLRGGADRGGWVSGRIRR